MDISFGLSRKGCQLLNLCEHANGNLPWLGIQPPASVQSHDVCIVSLLHYSWEHGIWASNLHRDTHTLHKCSCLEKIWLEGHCRVYAAYSCPSVLPNKCLPCLSLILERPKLHAHPMESTSGLTV